MDNRSRQEMESGFGVDFSGIRIHTGSSAVMLSKDLGAQAFTHGSDIYFNSGKYDPGSGMGKQLLAHELTHTVQQGATERLQPDLLLQDEEDVDLEKELAASEQDAIDAIDPGPALETREEAEKEKSRTPNSLPGRAIWRMIWRRRRATKPMHGFAVEELTSVFRTLQAAGWDAVLVGGQAVNVWACRYEQDGRAWRELRPYTSRDLDYHGGLAEARLAMRVLAARGHLNTGSDPSPNAGVLKVSLPDGHELLVDILTGVFGLRQRKSNARPSRGRAPECFRD